MVMCDMFLRVVIVMVVVVGVNCLTTTIKPSTQTPPEDVRRCSPDTCQDPWMDNPWSYDARCHCDSLCNNYGDCCYDSEYRNVSLQQVTGEGSEVTCHGIGVYMKARCKEGWSDAEVKNLCVGGGVDADPMSRLPVTSKATRHTYPNYYCAICNEDILDLRIWNGELQCYGLNLEDRVDSRDVLLRNNRLGFLRGRPESQEFVTCSLAPERPRDVENLTRSCSLSISTCSEDWQDKEIEALCHSYSVIVYRHMVVAYKNQYCLMCNNMLFGDYDFSLNYYCETAPELQGPPPFSLLFDFTDPSHGNLVGSSSPCDATQAWDPFLKRCRSIVCPKSNQYYRYGKCVTLSSVNSMGSSEPPTTSPVTTTVTESPADTYNNTNESNSRDPVNRSNDDNSITTITNNTTGVVNTTTPTPSNTTPEDVPTTTPSSQNFPEDKKPIVFPEETTEPPATPSEEESVTTFPPTTPSPDSSTPTSPSKDSPSPSDTAASTNKSSEFLECKKFNLSSGEFTFLPNGIVYVDAYERSYTPEDYENDTMTESILVCQPDIITSREFSKFSSALGWVSLAGLGLSCTCLLLHLAAFTLLPELRNLSGRNLASLCLALLAAYITFLVNMFMQPGPAGCITLAAAMYYFFLASFTWMNVIAFDVWYTFRLTQRQLRVSSGDQWHRFIAYSLYSWLVPAAATLVLVLVDQLEPSGLQEEFLPRLGRSWCWFSHRKALLAFFAAPMVIIIVMNCIFFISTAVIITQAGSTAAAASARDNNPRGQYKMYLRLAALMGFTWVSGIAAGYLNMEVLWYVFVVLNTSQGAFIFLAFTFRTRVWQGVGTAFNKVMQRTVSKVTRRPPPPDNRGFDLSHTPDSTSAASYSTHNTSLEAF